MGLKGLKVSDKDITLVLTPREQLGKGLGKMRRDGQLPAVIHIPGKDSVAVSGNLLDIVKVYQHAGRHHPIDLQVGEDKYFTIIKDVDFEPTKHALRHVVFGVIKRDEKVETEVPVELVGDAPAGKVGLVINKLIYELKVEALPKDLPDQLEVIIETLEQIGDKITVGDLVLPDGVTVLADPENVIVQVEEPTIQAEEPEAEEVPAEGETAEGTQETPAEGEPATEETKE